MTTSPEAAPTQPLRTGTVEYAEWLADKLHCTNDYGKEAASLLVKQAREIEQLKARIPIYIDDMTPGELHAYDMAVAEGMAAVLHVLDGKDEGDGVANEPWEPVRRRLLALVQRAP